jgi:CubicO group peptidase (beta-lactamase class C family)
MKTSISVVFAFSWLSASSILSLPVAAAPPPAADKVVEEWLDAAQAEGVPGAIIYVSTPYWEGTWTRGTADLETGRPIGAGDYFRIASISKTFTATVVLQLVDEGVLSLDETLSEFNGGFGVPLADRITVRQLMNHTSGLGAWDESTDVQNSNCNSSLTPAESLLVEWSPQSMVDQAVSVGQRAPGTGYEYEDTNYILLGMIVEWVLQSEVTGTRLAAEIQDRILVPLALNQTSYPLDSSIPEPAVHGYWIPADPDFDCQYWSDYTTLNDGVAYNPSREFGCGAMISTAADLAVWCRAYARGDLISADLHRDQLTWAWPGKIGGYGLGIMSLRGAVGHSGDFTFGYSSSIYYLPSRDAVIVVLLNREIPTFEATYVSAQLISGIFPPAPIPRPVSGDYRGEGKSDIAIFRMDSGLWAVRGLGRTYFGAGGSIPVPGDYAGDGYADLAVFRPSNGLWAVKNLTRFYFGDWRDTPVPGDYDGDGVCDPAVFKDLTGLWAIRGVTRFYFGQQFDWPLSGDFSGDGTAQAAVFRPSTILGPGAGLWAVRGQTRFYFGRTGDLPAPGVFGWYGAAREAGPFRLQPAVFRPETGLWAVRGMTRFYYGRFGDLPVPADFDGNTLADPAVFRPSAGLWAIRSLTRAYFGQNYDLPVTR